MGVKKVRGRWVADWREDGKRYRKFFIIEKDARIHFEQRKLDKLQNIMKWGIGRGLTLNDMVERYSNHSAHTNKPKTIVTNQGLLKNILPILGKAKLKEINLKTIEDYKIERSKTPNRRTKNGKGNPVSKATINREIGLVKHILSLAVEWELLEKNGLQFMKFYKEHKRNYYFTRDQILLLLEKARQPIRDIILFAVATGMRKGEILSLKWSDITYSPTLSTTENFITLRNTKSGETRIVPLNSISEKIIVKRLNEKQSPKYLFANPATGKPYEDIKRQWKGLLKSLSLSDYHFHDLRHTFASYALTGGSDIFTLKDVMGHQKLVTTEKYLSTLKEKKQVMMADIAGLFNDIEV